MPLKAGLKKKTEQEKEQKYTKPVNNVSLPKKSSVSTASTTAKKAAQTIKKDTVKKSSVSSSGYVRQSPKLNKVKREQEQKKWDTEKGSYKTDSKNNVGRTGSNTPKKSVSQWVAELNESTGGKKYPYEGVSRDKIFSQKQSGHQNKQNLEKSNKNLRNNERHQAYTDPYFVNIAGEEASNNAIPKFFGNLSEAAINYSPVGLPATVLSGSTPSEWDFFKPHNYTKEDEYRNNRFHSGLSAMGGQLVGGAIGFNAGRGLGYMKAYEGFADDIINGTKLGNAIKNSSMAGKIGTKLGTQAADDIIRNGVAEGLRDITMGVGENAVISYGEGNRGMDWLKDTAMQTGADLALGYGFSSADTGLKLRGVSKLLNTNPADLLRKSNNKSSYMNKLLAKAEENLRRLDIEGLSKEVRDAHLNKAAELMTELENVRNMDDTLFKEYRRNGEMPDLSNIGKTVTDSAGSTTEEAAENVKRYNSSSTGKNVTSPKAKTNGKPKTETAKVDYSKSFGEPNESIYSFNPKENAEDVGTTNRAVLSRSNELQPDYKINNQDGRLRTANEIRNENELKSEIDRYSDIEKEVRENFPEATAEEREALATAMRNNDLEAYQKAEAEIAARQEASINETASRTNYAEKPKEVATNRTGIGRQNELQAGKSKATQSRRLRTADEIKAEQLKSANAKPNAEKKALKKAVDYSKENVEKVINGEAPLSSVKEPHLRQYCKDNDIEVPRGTKKGGILDLIIKHNKEQQTPKANIVKPAKETPKAPSEIPSTPIEDIKKLEKGSFVIHKNYGIGEFTGIEKVGGEKMARVKFADSDSGLSSATYVPLEKVDDFLSKYAGEGEPKLDKMFNKRSTESTNAQFEDYISGNADPNKKITETGISDFNPESPKGGEATISGDTYSVKNNGKELPKKKPKGLTGEHGRKAIERTAEWKEKNLPKNNEKVNTETPKAEKPKAEKPFTSESTSNDIANKFGESKKSTTFSKIDETIGQSADGKTTKSYETYMRSPEIDDEAKKVMKELHDNNEAFIKNTVTNKQVLAEAERKAKNNFDELYDTFMSNAKNGRQATSQDEADALILVRELCNRGDFSKAAKVNAELSAMATENARFLQAQRIWRALTPEGRVRSTLSAIRRLEKSRGMESGSIIIGEEGEKLLKAIYDAETNAQIARANGEFQRYIWNQIPSTFAEKCNAWRYLAMLANPRTHIRNVLGNAAFIPARMMSNALATVGERAFAKTIANMGGEVRGTHAILNVFNSNDRALYRKAGESFKDDRALMESMSAKFLDKQRPYPKISFNKSGKGLPKMNVESSTFRGKILQFLEWLNSNGLEKEDEMFMGVAYRSAYAQYCKANGIKASDITDDMSKRISDYAQEEALKATYRDANALADAFNKMRKNLNVKKSDSLGMKIGKKSAGFLLDSTVPFVKTPLNILKQGVIEYNPIRAFHGLAKIIDGCSRGDADSLLKGIQYASTGLTGTGVLALGAVLGMRGYLNGSMGKYDKKVAYDQMLGEQDYSVTVPFADKDITINLDWVAPMSMPLFVGVEFGNMINAGGDDANIDDKLSYVIEALSNISDPIFEMSMLQGVENVFNTAISDSKGLSTIAKNAGFNYISQYVPTLFGQISRTMADNKKTVVSTSDNPLVKEFEKQFGKMLNKTPIGNAVNQDYVDQWGRVQANDNKGRSILENFISPAYLKNKNETAVDTEIKRLYEALDEEDKDKIIPSVSSTAYKQKFDDEEFIMTPSEFTQYKKTVGQAKFNGLKELFSTDKYKEASDDEKRKMIETVYDNAAKEGKKEFLTKASSEFASAPDFYMMDKTTREKYSETVGIGKQEWAKIYTDFQTATEKNEDGTGGLNADEKRAYLLDHGVETYEQAQSFLGESTSKDKWDEAVELKKSGKTLAIIQKEAQEKEERQKNMTETEKKFDDNFRVRSDTRRKSVSSPPDDDKLYKAFLYETQYVDKHSDNNGVIKQAEAQNAIENLDQMYGLTDEQKAYYWWLASGDDGWKKKPFGDYIP